VRTINVNGSQPFLHAAADGAHRLPWFWFFFTVAVLLLSAIDRYHIVSQFKQRERVVIIDPAGTYYLTPLLQFSEAGDFHFHFRVEPLSFCK
jgi:hypothetical protein